MRKFTYSGVFANSYEQNWLNEISILVRQKRENIVEILFTKGDLTTETYYQGSENILRIILVWNVIPYQNRFRHNTLSASYFFSKHQLEKWLPYPHRLTTFECKSRSS